MEPTSSTTGGFLAIKFFGGMAGMAAIGAGLAAIVVMCLMPPRKKSEWIVGLISTVVGSIAGGAAVITHYELLHWAQHPIGLVAVLGVVFACGLPAWAIVRWVFNFIEKRQGHDLRQIIDELRGK